MKASEEGGKRRRAAAWREKAGGVGREEGEPAGGRRRCRQAGPTWQRERKEVGWWAGGMGLLGRGEKKRGEGEMWAGLGREKKEFFFNTNFI